MSTDSATDPDGGTTDPHQVPDARTPAPGAAASTWLAHHTGEVTASLAGLREHAAVLDRWGVHLARVLDGGGRLLVAGNGGSAAEAQHLTAELVGRFEGERRPLSAIALHAETSSTSAIVNDYGHLEVYARQVAAHGRAGDVLLLLSTSGRSGNVLRAAERARTLGLSVWAMTGPGPNPLTEAADEALTVLGPSTSAVQEGHLVAVHALCAAVDAHLLAPARSSDGGLVDGPAGGAPLRGTVTDGGVSGRSLTEEPEPGRTLTAATGADPAGARGAAAPAAEDTSASSAAPAPAPPAHRSRGARRRVVVVGDVVLDRDLLGRSERIAPDAPVPVVDLEGVQESPGGAGLTALLCAAGDVDVELLAPVADDDAGEALATALAQHPTPVVLHRLGHTGGTRTKTRVRVSGQSLVRLDDGGPGTPWGVDAAVVARVLDGADVVLVSDYGAGTTHDPVVREELARTAQRVPVVWDPHPRGGAPVPGCVLVTPNLAEAVAATGTGAAGRSRPDEVAVALASTWRARGVCVTTGAQGAWLAAPGSEPLFAPAPLVAGGDPCGAGDRFAASAAVSLASGSVPSEAVAVAVLDASAWVAAGGASGWREAARRAGDPTPVGRVAPPSAATAGGPRGGVPAEALATRMRATGGTLVATGGCFDVLHAGHVACLEAARRLGDGLVVLLNSDESVRRLKGPHRPVNRVEDRARVLAALDSVDAVVVFDEDDPRAALDALRPDVWAKGGDYGGTELPEADLVRSWGGRVVLLPYLDGRSTSAILARGAASALGRGAPELPFATDQEVS